MQQYLEKESRKIYHHVDIQVREIFCRYCKFKLLRHHLLMKHFLCVLNASKFRILYDN